MLVNSLVFFNSCSKLETKISLYEDAIQQGVDSYQRADLLSKDFIIIIPRLGCTGCIGKAEQFLIDNNDSYSGLLGFILTDIISVKTLKARLGKKILASRNVLIDTKSVIKIEDSKTSIQQY